MKVKVELNLSAGTIAWLRAEAQRRNNDPGYRSHDWTWRDVVAVEAQMAIGDLAAREFGLAQNQQPPQEAVA